MSEPEPSLFQALRGLSFEMQLHEREVCRVNANSEFFADYTCGTLAWVCASFCAYTRENGQPLESSLLCDANVVAALDKLYKLSSTSNMYCFDIRSLDAAACSVIQAYRRIVAPELCEDQVVETTSYVPEDVRAGAAAEFTGACEQMFNSLILYPAWSQHRLDAQIRFVDAYRKLREVNGG